MVKLLKSNTLNFLKKYNINILPSIDEQQLIDETEVIQLLDSIEISSNDVVLEVGPGAGNITVPLVQRSGFVYVIEKNKKYFPLLHERTQDLKNLEIIEGDILKTKLPKCNKVVSNLPYRILEAFMHRLQWYKFEAAALIVSLSFAKILLANEKEENYSKLSYESQLFFKINFIKEINESVYYPPPSSKTCLITVKPQENSNLKENIIKNLLLQSDKKIKNALIEAIIRGYKTSNINLTKNYSKQFIQKLNLNFDLNKKVARLTLNDLINIKKALDII